MLYMAINFGDWVLTGQPSRSSCLSEPLAIATAGSAKRHTYIPISRLSSCACDGTLAGVYARSHHVTETLYEASLPSSLVIATK